MRPITKMLTDLQKIIIGIFLYIAQHILWILSDKGIPRGLAKKRDLSKIHERSYPTYDSTQGYALSFAYEYIEDKDIPSSSKISYKCFPIIPKFTTKSKNIRAYIPLRLAETYYPLKFPIFSP